jgi:hypothetical protein
MDPPNTSNTSSNNSDKNSENDNQSDCDTCPEYPSCPNNVEPEKCEPTFVPINLELCPVVKVMVNKPKICLQNKAECTPCFFLDNCSNK